MSDAATTPVISPKQKQLAEQCRVVAAIAKAIADVHSDLAKLHVVYPQDDSFVDMVGRWTAERMELLGDMANGMDIVQPEDDWMDPIFRKANELWPVKTPRNP